MHARSIPFLAAVLAMASAACAREAAPATSPARPPPAAAAAAEPDDGLAKLSDDELARKLLAVTGGADIGKQIADKMMDAFRAMPNIPPGFTERFKQNVHPESFVDLVVPIYLKHYDRPTMIAAIRFYESEPGRKMVHELPAAMAEAMEAGKKWGADLAKKTLNDLAASPPSP